MVAEIQGRVSLSYTHIHTHTHTLSDTYIHTDYTWTPHTYRIYTIRRGGGLLFIKINLQTRLLIVTRLVNEA